MSTDKSYKLASKFKCDISGGIFELFGVWIPFEVTSLSKGAGGNKLPQAGMLVVK